MPRLRRCGPPSLAASSAPTRTRALALPSRLNHRRDCPAQRGRPSTTMRDRPGTTNTHTLGACTDTTRSTLRAPGAEFSGSPIRLVLRERDPGGRHPIQVPPACPVCASERPDHNDAAHEEHDETANPRVALGGEKQHDHPQQPLKAIADHQPDEIRHDRGDLLPHLLCPVSEPCDIFLIPRGSVARIPDHGVHFDGELDPALDTSVPSGWTTSPPKGELSPPLRRDTMHEVGDLVA